MRIYLGGTDDTLPKRTFLSDRKHADSIMRYEEKEVEFSRLNSDCMIFGELLTRYLELVIHQLVEMSPDVMRNDDRV